MLLSKRLGDHIVDELTNVGSIDGEAHDSECLSLNAGVWRVEQ